MVGLKTCVGAFEAKTHLSKLLDRVEKGDRITITRHGRKVAVLGPVEKVPTPRLPEIIEEALAASKGVKWPKGMTSKHMINAGWKR